MFTVSIVRALCKRNLRIYFQKKTTFCTKLFMYLLVHVSEIFQAVRGLIWLGIYFKQNIWLSMNWILFFKKSWHLNTIGCYIFIQVLTILFCCCCFDRGQCEALYRRYCDQPCCQSAEEIQEVWGTGRGSLRHNHLSVSRRWAVHGSNLHSQ